MPSTLVDSGPLYALFSKKDLHHDSALAFIARRHSKLMTNVLVVMEVVHLLRRDRVSQTKFLHWVQKALVLEPVTARDQSRIFELLDVYADLPADLADVSLVALAERLKLRRIATVDSDFAVYRINGKQPFENVFWPAK
jgi:uncharacterized protein